MKQEMIINGYSVLGNITATRKINESTKKELNLVEFEGSIKGEKEFNNYKNAIEYSKINVKVPEQDLEFKAQKNGYSFSYTDREDKEDNIYNIKINLLEIDDSQSKYSGLEIFGNIGFGISMNWARTRALSELLIEKGLITLEEYESKIKFIYERDKDEFTKALLAGTSKDESPKED